MFKMPFMVSPESEGDDFPLVSICIPTHMRPSFLEAAIQSIVSQEYPNLEIVVGDDSSDDESKSVIERLATSTTVPIRYRRHSPKLGQNANVNYLIGEATGSYLILLHDDDLLEPQAIHALMAPVRSDPRIRLVNGKQTLISESGEILTERTQNLNRKYGRRRSSGRIEKPLEAALLQVIPNDGYLIETGLAREVMYRTADEIGPRGDIDFIIRVAQLAGPNDFWFVDEFIGRYRISSDAISMSSKSRKIDHPRAGTALFKAVTQLNLPQTSEFARRSLLRDFSPSMVKGFALQRNRRTALRIYLSKAYGWRKRLTLRGLYHLLLIVSPSFDRIRSY